MVNPGTPITLRTPLGVAPEKKKECKGIDENKKTYTVLYTQYPINV